MAALKRLTDRVPFDAAGFVSAMAWAALAFASLRTQPVPALFLVAVMLIAWTALAVAWRRARGMGEARLSVRIWTWAIVFRLVGLLAEPVLEDDHYRFLWDGYRFAETGNPYGVAPAEFFGDESIPPEQQRVLGSVNHPHLATIYGPAAQWGFRLAHAISPASILSWKILLTLADLTTIALLARIAAPANVLLYAWCPLSIQETAFNGHPEALGVLAMVAAVRWSFAGKGTLSGVAIALAAGVKITGGLLAPLLWWRSGWKAVSGTIIAVLALWGPFWIRGSLTELPALAAMSGEWEFNSSVFGLLSWTAGREWAQWVCLAGLAAIALHQARAMRGKVQWPRGDHVYGGFFLLAPVVNPWYMLWVLPFAAIRPRAWTIAALVLVSVSYLHGLNWGGGALAPYEHPAWLRPLEYGGVAIAAWLGRGSFKEVAG